MKRFSLRVFEAVCLSLAAVAVVRVLEFFLGPSMTQSLLNPLAMVVLAAYRPRAK